jgi:hypothetical protein
MNSRDTTELDELQGYQPPLHARKYEELRLTVLG